MNQEYIEKTYLTKSTSKNPQRKIITQQVPKFDWDKFKLLPNAADFVEKFYDQLTTQMMREVAEVKNGTTKEHLNSMESIIARAIMFTTQDIEEWCDEQDWQSVGITQDRVSNIKKHLSSFGMRSGGANAERSISLDKRKKLAERIMQVVGKGDRLADWLFTRLTNQITEEDSI